MADASKNFDKAFYPNFYHVIDSLKTNLNGRDIETSLILNKIDKITPVKKRQSKIDIVSASLMEENPMFTRIIPLSIRSEINVEVLKVI